MKKINYLYFSGFTSWSMLLLLRIYRILPYEKISQISAQVEFFLHFFMLAIAFKMYSRGRKEDRKILFWMTSFNICLFLNDLFYYFAIYFSQNNNFNLLFVNFIILIIPYSIWIISAIIFLIYILIDIFDSKNFIKLFSMLMLVN